MAALPAGDSLRFTRREALALLASLPAAGVAGCGDWTQTLPAGEIVGASAKFGHRLRGGSESLKARVGRWTSTRVLIVGAGAAGLSAAWRLQRAEMDDFLVVELEPVAGGTSRSGASKQTGYPWGAHYLPAPLPENRDLLSLLEEMGLIEGWSEAGVPIFGEQYLCRAPQERVFFQGRWHAGLYPLEGATERDLAELHAFEEEVNRWAAWRDADGRRAFGIPVASCSDAAEVRRLDEISMQGWLERQGWTSPRLHWLVDYSCRDDYGSHSEQTSAWAGLFFFAARVPAAGEESQPFLTWPEGNGRLIQHLLEKVSSQVRLGTAAADISFPTEGGDGRVVEILALEGDGTVSGYRAERVIFAAPQFLAPYVIRGYQEARGEIAREFQYAPWVVANLLLRDRPAGGGFPLCWDNVLYDSPSLGYVVATHQLGIDYGPTVLTYYLALCDEQPEVARQMMLDVGWEHWAELILRDLEQAHPDIRSLTERLDVMLWGHAMIQPRPGFVWSDARRGAARPFRCVHFAHTDLSGVALFEEAFWQGKRAAEEVLQELQAPCPPMSS